MVKVPQVRLATLSDAPEIARLSSQWGYPVSEQDLRTRLGHLLSSPRHIILVAEGDGALLGWGAGEIRVFIGSDPRVEITGLVVDVAARRSGVGSLLVARIERWALEERCHEVFLRSNVARVESHPFYEHIGFERTKTQHAYKKVLRDA